MNIHSIHLHQHFRHPPCRASLQPLPSVSPLHSYRPVHCTLPCSQSPGPVPKPKQRISLDVRPTAQSRRPFSVRNRRITEHRAPLVPNDPRYMHRPVPTTVTERNTERRRKKEQEQQCMYIRICGHFCLCLCLCNCPCLCPYVAFLFYFISFYFIFFCNPPAV